MDDFDYTDLSFKCRLAFIKEIRDAFAAFPPERAQNLHRIFGRTSFGPWLELTNIGQDPILVHMFLQLEVEVASAEPEEMYFNVCGNLMHFGRREFCIVTGLLFGPTPSLLTLTDESFVSRVWPDLAPGLLTLKTVVQTMRNDLQAISDEDAVRVCLVVMADVMFMGRDLRLVVSSTVLSVVDDFGRFNSYPWGSYIWRHSYKGLHCAITRRKQKNQNNNKMTLNGFAHALKVWILEMFPVCLQNFTKRSDRLIRGTRWDRDAVLNKSACIGIFNSVLNVGHGPLAELRPTHAEQQSSWFQRSVAFFESSAGRRSTKRSRRRDLDHDDNDDDDDEDDDDGARYQTPPSSRYQAPPSSSHHGVPSLDPYQHKWEYMDSMDRRIRELEALTAHLRHTHVSTSMAPTYTSPGHIHGYTHGASATPLFQQSVSYDECSL
ncbi:hypothetical protein L6452_28272 [Arctium lappa]|uniref:Uncharacterized protein n=1 Tax=Arctium lappa TaxID=4217 RepID=A0ACB8ZX03_ARCLA|nr:hypothetical protein L6452_28272 [Arctium lappa]